MSSCRVAFRVLVCLLLVGGVATFVNHRLPLVRNSLVYARASEHVIAHGYDPRLVVADSRLSYDKPILYAWMSAPFVAALGNHDGLRMTSFLTTALYLLAVLHLARSFRTDLPEPGGALLLWLAAIGPCVVYQFWSAHPDGGFAALVVLAWSITHRLVADPRARPVLGVLGLGVVVLGAVLLKNYGLVLLISCPAYLVWNLRTLRANPGRFRRLLGAALVVFGALGVFVWTARTGHNSLSRLTGQGGGVGQYGAGELGQSSAGTGMQLLLAFFVQFQVALVFAVRRGAWGRALVAPFACFAGPYAMGLMPFPTTFYNMRYFLPLFPLVALVLVRGGNGTRSTVKRGILAAHGVLAVALVLVFNAAPAYRLVRPAIPRLEVDWLGVPLSLLDNLRMPLHLQQAKVLDHINAEIPPEDTLYFLDVNYYGDAQHGVYERAGLLRGGIATKYLTAREFAAAGGDSWVWSARPPVLPSPSTVRDFGLGLYHVRRGAGH